jgi:hypothetical protein
VLAVVGTLLAGGPGVARARTLPESEVAQPGVTTAEREQVRDVLGRAPEGSVRAIGKSGADLVVIDIERDGSGLRSRQIAERGQVTTDLTTVVERRGDQLQATVQSQDGTVHRVEEPSPPATVKGDCPGCPGATFAVSTTSAYMCAYGPPQACVAWAGAAGLGLLIICFWCHLTGLPHHPEDYFPPVP